MEPKKNPKADLSKRSVLFFQLGLILILGLSYLAIEWKTYEKEAIDIGQLQMDDMLEEDVPISLAALLIDKCLDSLKCFKRIDSSVTDFLSQRRVFFFFVVIPTSILTFRKSSLDTLSSQLITIT